MTVDFFFSRLQTENAGRWEVIADFAAAMHGFMPRDYTGAGDFLWRLHQLQSAVNAMVTAAEKLE